MPTYAAFAARLDATAATYEPRVRAGIIRACSPCADAYAAGATPEVAALLLRMAYVTDPLAQMIERHGLREAKLTYDRLTGTVKALPSVGLLASWASRLRSYLSTESALSIRALTATLRAKVVAVLQQAGREGLGIDAAARLLRQEVATFSVEQAKTVVRTELIGASNAASLMGAQSTGLRLEKVWLATPGPRTRATHAAVDGQAVALTGSFTVGGAIARYPGDPLLPASERIRCRCTQIYRPVK